MAPPLELTLIVAATRDMGIGRNGTLPWTGLKKEMAYFARVTKRPPPSSPSCPSAATAVPVPVPPAQITSDSRTARNAVIMGRKTWDSIPPRFRPLPGRLNVVVSRSRSVADLLAASKEGGGSAASGREEKEKEEEEEENVLVAGSLEEAVGLLEDRRRRGAALGRAFVIGGAQIYGAALGLPTAATAAAVRVLLTRVRGEFACDAFFPLRLEEKEGEEEGEKSGGGRGTCAAKKGWRRCSQEEMDAWVGEQVPRGVQREAGTEYEFEMWERVD